MTDYLDKVRLIAARMEGEKCPSIIGAIAETTWEIIPPEDWDRVRNELAEKWLGPDWTAYDFIEVIVEIPNANLAAMFDARSLGRVEPTEAS